jgi:YspA, cpYpsA-related SLOG family
MKVAVIGSRSFNDREMLFEELDKIQGIEMIASGGTKVADKLAESYAFEKNIPLLIFRPDWSKEYGYYYFLDGNNVEWTKSL